MSLSEKMARLKALELARLDAQCSSITFEKMMERASTYERFIAGSSSASENSHGPLDKGVYLFRFCMDEATSRDGRTSGISIRFSHDPDKVLFGHSGFCAHFLTPSSDKQHPADSYSAGRTGSVAGHACDQSGCVVHDGPAEQEGGRDCGSFPSPTDAELRQHGCPALVEPRARTFLCQLPDSDLAAINAGVIPTPLMKLLGRVAYNEIERRRETDDA